jgi:hypothetical protein
MRKVIIAAVAALSIAPFTTSILVAHADSGVPPPPLPPGSCQIGTGTCSIATGEGENGGYVPAPGALGQQGWLVPGGPAPGAPAVPAPAAPPVPAPAAPPVQAAPAPPQANSPAPPGNVPNDNCAKDLQPPNPSVGAYNGCELAKRATGG